MKFLGMLAGLFLALSGNVLAYEEEKPEWVEAPLMLPAPPKDSSLQSFYVSAATTNRFWVDLATLDVGADGVVRYVLVMETPEGARNVSFEGMRCETREQRYYASGKRDGGWTLARKSDWRKIADIGLNRYHAALFLEYFCPGGVIVRTLDEAREALRRGVHPDNKRW